MKRDEGYTSGRETVCDWGNNGGMLSGKNRQLCAFVHICFELAQTLHFMGKMGETEPETLQAAAVSEEIR